MKTDTIAAIATAMTNSGIGIVRVSGDESISVVNKIFRNKNNHEVLDKVRSHTIHYGFIYNGNELIDEVLVMIMKGPKSYTAEDTVEINCHGGVHVVKRVLESVISNGARPAEPGEFTKRAFLNGRIDLSKAEAVADIINSKNDFALKSSINQLKGFVSDQIIQMRREILHHIAYIESALDDPENISLDGYSENLNLIVNNLIVQIDKLLASGNYGKILKEGINTVIVGKPNAGKSSLLNTLIGEEKAIVTNIAGTTRDIIEETIHIKGIQFNLIDTAGICITDNEVEKIGIEKAKKYIKDSDLVIYVVDSSVPLDEQDKEIMMLIREKKKIVLWNKSDLQPAVNEDELIESVFTNIGENIKESLVKTSTINRYGIEELESHIEKMFFDGKIEFNDEVYITNLRHKDALEDSVESLKNVNISINNGMPEDFYSIDLMSAYKSLGSIIGEEIGEDLVNEIFSKFCMGK